MLIATYINECGIDVEYVDPMTDDDRTSTGPAVFLMAHSASTTYEYTGNSHKDALYCDIPERSIVVDPWRKFNAVSGVIVEHYGNTRTIK